MSGGTTHARRAKVLTLIFLALLFATSAASSASGVESHEAQRADNWDAYTRVATKAVSRLVTGPYDAYQLVNSGLTTYVETPQGVTSTADCDGQDLLTGYESITKLIAEATTTVDVDPCDDFPQQYVIDDPNNSAFITPEEMVERINSVGYRAAKMKKIPSSKVGSTTRVEIQRAKRRVSIRFLKTSPRSPKRILIRGNKVKVSR